MSATALIVSGVGLKPDKVSTIIDKAKLWAILQGVQMLPQSHPDSKSSVEYAPLTLFPSPVPEPVWSEAKSLQKDFNVLMHRVALDHDFLEQTLHNVVKVDPFTQKLWEIYMTVRQEGIQQPVTLGLFRNDFMFDVKNSCCDIKGLPACLRLKQIEFNTIAASFAGLSSGIWNVHRYTMAQAGIEVPQKQIPQNSPARGLAVGILRAWEYYNVESAVVMFVVQGTERNTMDQRLVEADLFSMNRRVTVQYVTLQEACRHCTLSRDKKLIFHDTEVAVIYFRDGYSPDHYHSDKEWSIRLLMERSRAVKCPSVSLQLAGCKKVQQQLAAPGQLERFLKDSCVCEKLRSTFAGQYTLDTGAEGDKNIEMVLENPKFYVMKPQREGGGNNIYGEDIPAFLESVRHTEERNAYILMERIFPWPQKNYLLKEGHDPILRDVISELGIYGVYLGSDKEELHNEEVGHLLRTKSNDDDEGGIMAGFATIDSPMLVDPPCLTVDYDMCSDIYVE